MTLAATVDPESPGVDAGRLGRDVNPIREGRRSIGTSSRASVCASDRTKSRKVPRLSLDVSARVLEPGGRPGG